MNRRILLSLILFCLVISFTAQAQPQKVEHLKQKTLIRTIENQLPQNTQSAEKQSRFIFPVVNPGNGDVIAQTTYPWIANSIAHDQISYDPHSGYVYFSPVIYPNSMGSGSVNLIIYDGVNYTSRELPNPDSPVNRTSWSHIDIPTQGLLANQNYAGIAAGEFYLWNGNDFTRTVGNFATVQFSGDNIFTTGWEYFKSSDYGSTFEKWGDYTDFMPPLYDYSLSPVTDCDFFKSPNEQHLVMAGCLPGGGNAGLGGEPGVDSSNADITYIIYSHDFGVTWTAQIIAYDGQPGLVPDYTYTTHVDTLEVTGKGQIPFNQDVTWEYYPLPENFSQITGAVSNDGTIHIVLNGYGQWRKEIALPEEYGGGKEIFGLPYATPVLYWNSKLKDAGWKVISDFNIDLFAQELYDRGIAYDYPGNLMGQSFPQIAQDYTGQNLFACWTGPEFQTPGDAASQIMIDELGENFTDIYYSYSDNGGDTWIYGGILHSTPMIADAYAQLSYHLEKAGDDGAYTAHLMLIENPSPMMVSDGTGPVSNFIYRKYQTVFSNVDNNKTNVINFILGDNYPNPFNPSTVISFQLSVFSEVRLVVYDLLGREVATVVNEYKSPGIYKVEFNASNFPSGVYFYQLKSGNFIETKKMVLLK
ncbi:MAG: T9SS type A sorting domain-containing protein [bacterium]